MQRPVEQRHKRDDKQAQGPDDIQIQRGNGHQAAEEYTGQAHAAAAVQTGEHDGQAHAGVKEEGQDQIGVIPHFRAHLFNQQRAEDRRRRRGQDRLKAQQGPAGHAGKGNMPQAVPNHGLVTQDKEAADDRTEDGHEKAREPGPLHKIQPKDFHGSLLIPSGCRRRNSRACDDGAGLREWGRKSTARHHPGKSPSWHTGRPFPGRGTP